MAEDRGRTPVPETLTGTDISNQCNNVIAVAEQAFDAFFDGLSELYCESRRPMAQYAAYKGWKKFLKVAKICIDNGWDARDYVREVMSMPIGDRAATLVSDLISDKVVKEVSRRFSEEPFDYNKTLTFCINTVNTLRKSGRSEEEILLDPETPIPAWFRVLYRKNPNRRILEEWAGMAADELETGHSLMEFVKVNFSENLKALMNANEANEPRKG